MHVQSDLVYWIWYPEDLANAVPNEVAWGRVKYTGRRLKVLGWFPEVKDVEAIPLSELPMLISSGCFSFTQMDRRNVVQE